MEKEHRRRGRNKKKGRNLHEKDAPMREDRGVIGLGVEGGFELLLGDCEELLGFVRRVRAGLVEKSNSYGG